MSYIGSVKNDLVLSVRIDFESIQVNLRFLVGITHEPSYTRKMKFMAN